MHHKNSTSSACTVIALQRWHIPNLWMMNLKQAQFGESVGIMLTGLSPKAQMDISKQDVPRSVNICAHHPRTRPILVKMMHSILDDWPPTEKLDIHEISWFTSIFSFTSKPVNIILLASMKNATCNSYRADWCSGTSLRLKTLHRGNILKVWLLCVFVLTLM